MFKPKRPPTDSPGSDSEMFDLPGQIKKWAINMFVNTATRDQKRLDLNELELRFVWDDIVVSHAKPKYHDAIMTKLPNAHSLFSTTFRNNTDNDQEYSLRIDRSTRSTAEVEIQKGVIHAKEMSVKLMLPSQVLEANAGFKKELSLNSSNRQGIEEELSWGIDTRIAVSPKHDAHADIKIVEEELTSKFCMLTTMYGQIRVVFLDASKGNHAVVKYVSGDLGTIVEDGLPTKSQQYNGMDRTCHVWTDPMRTGNRMLCIETHGSCKFRFGVHQKVEVNEVKF